MSPESERTTLHRRTPRHRRPRHAPARRRALVEPGRLALTGAIRLGCHAARLVLRRGPRRAPRVSPSLCHSGRSCTVRPASPLLGSHHPPQLLTPLCSLTLLLCDEAFACASLTCVALKLTARGSRSTLARGPAFGRRLVRSPPNRACLCRGWLWPCSANKSRSVSQASLLPPPLKFSYHSRLVYTGLTHPIQ